MLFLGVDGGSTKTAYCLTDETGTIRAQVDTEGCNVLQLGEERFARRMREGKDRLLAMAGIELRDLTGVHMGLTAYGETPYGTEQINRVMAQTYPQVPLACSGDAEIAWAGSLGGQAGINIVAGTGSIAYGENGEKKARTGGWSCTFCDEGSAHWTARQAIQLFTRQADGRAPKSALYELTRAEYALEEDLHFICQINTDFLRNAAKAAQYQMVLLKAWQQGDTQAEAIYRAGAQALVEMVMSLHGQLGFAHGEPVALSRSGSMFKNEAYLKLLEENLPTGVFRLTQPLASPVAGAVILAARQFLPREGMPSFLNALNRAGI